MVTKQGTLIIISSAVIDQSGENTFDPSQLSILDLEGGGGLAEDKQAGYVTSKKLIGFVKFQSVLVIVFYCRDEEQQLQFGMSFESRLQASNEVFDTAEMSFSKSEQSLQKRTLAQKNLSFAIVDSKFVWFNFEQKSIWHFELGEQLSSGLAQNEFDWRTISCKGFSVEQAMDSFHRADFIKHGVHLSEIPGNAVLRKKKIREDHDGDLSLLQIMFDNHAIVYNLQPENKYEVAIMHNIDMYIDPIQFSMTGFFCDTKAKSLTVNHDNSLGVIQAPQFKGGHSVVRALCEMDYMQVIQINDLVNKKHHFQAGKTLTQIEPEAIISDYTGETFFSIFEEQVNVYKIVFD